MQRRMVILSVVFVTGAFNLAVAPGVKPSRDRLSRLESRTVPPAQRLP